MKIKKQEFTVSVKADVFFEAKIKALTLCEALETAEKMDFTALWESPGDIISSEHNVTAVFG
jgi:hypothetical protein